MSKVLEVEQLTIIANGKALFPPISFTVNEGETLGLVGASGSGKSLTTLAIGGLLPPPLKAQSITIQFYTSEQTPILLSDKKFPSGILGKNIAYIFQEPSAALNPTMTCGEQLSECVQNGEKEVVGLLKMVQLKDPEKVAVSYPFELSGGQQQRVMIAIALAQRPRLLIADEPTTALDATIQKSVLDLLKTLQKELGFGLILISHDVHVLQYMSHNIVNIGSPITQYKNGGVVSHYQQLTTDTIVEFQNVSFSYQKSKGIFSFGKEYFQALSDFNFTIGRHQRMALIGESGSGKSTIAKLLTGILKPDTGTIVFHSTKPPKNIVQLVFQDYGNALSPRMTVFEILKESIIAFQPNATKINETMMELLNQVNLTDTVLNKYPHQLSGGQKQRISIARAMASQPELLILDESLNALDIENQEYIIETLNRIFYQNYVSLLYITHDLILAQKVADWIGVLESGNLVEFGEINAALKNPKHQHTKELINSML